MSPTSERVAACELAPRCRAGGDMSMHVVELMPSTDVLVVFFARIRPPLTRSPGRLFPVGYRGHQAAVARRKIAPEYHCHEQISPSPGRSSREILTDQVPDSTGY
jgi:hypothetical protein